MLNSGKLKAIMIDKDIDAEQLAECLGVHRCTVFRWMSDEHLDVAPHTVRSIANVLGCESEEIMDLRAYGIPEPTPDGDAEGEKEQV